MLGEDERAGVGVGVGVGGEPRDPAIGEPDDAKVGLSERSTLHDTDDERGYRGKRDDDAIADSMKVYKLDQSSPMRVSSLSRSAFSLAHRAYPMLATLAKLRPSPAMEHPGASQHATLRPRISLRLALAPSEYGC